MLRTLVATAMVISLTVVVVATGIGRTSGAQDPIRPPVSPEQAPALVMELGCAGCHVGAGDNDLTRGRAPSLVHAGARYRPGFTFRFLGAPTRVRGLAGNSRMPDFGLDERERVALALYLATLNAAPEPPVRYPPAVTDGRDPRIGRREAERVLREDGECLTCHNLGGEGGGGQTAIDLTTTAGRVENEWLRRYLAAPHAFVPGTIMPGFFYAWDSASGELTERVADAGPTLRRFASAVIALGEDDRREVDREFARARDRHPDATPAVGERIFSALNCAGCHRHGSDVGQPVGPPFMGMGTRIRGAWLRTYLARPHAVRPAGVVPGSGSRMPDFGLSADEVETIAAWLETLRRPLVPPYEAESLSVFSTAKAEALVRDRLPCLGCHRLNGDGGRIGPDLSDVGNRLHPAAIRAMIDDPAGTMPGSAMPRVLMPADRIDLLADYLAGRQGGSGAAPYLGFDSLPSEDPATPDSSGAGLYRRHCAACHGAAGDGDGFNAPFLPVSPTRHADSAAMAVRPDDTLFDGIHVGAYILGKSHRMPGFGQMLTSPEIRRLVAHIRTLCRCEGPAWSRDNRGSR